MGNCGLGGFGEADGSTIKVVTCNGGVMELYPPVVAEFITSRFPGHRIFRGTNPFSQPLTHDEELVGGEPYYLRPLNGLHAGGLPSLVAPYRVSFDQRGFWRRRDLDMVHKCSSGGKCGMWKVRLVISPAQLVEILSQGSQTEALMESVVTVAKCGNGTASVAASSDQWSRSGSRKAGLENNIG